MEDLTSSVLASDHGNYGNSLQTTDIWNQNDNRLAATPVIQKRFKNKNRKKKNKK